MLYILTCVYSITYLDIFSFYNMCMASASFVMFGVYGLQSTITALFAAGEDVGEALAMAANSVGMKEMPRYEVEELADCDWVLEVEVLLCSDSVLSS